MAAADDRTLSDPRTHGHTPADERLCWQGLARMAAARRAAGVKLSALDRQALDRYPPTPDQETP